MFCSKCGARLVEGATFCSACGASQTAAQAIPPSPTPEVLPLPMPMPAYAMQGPTLYAGFWLRFVAMIIDSIVIGIPFALVIAILAMMMGVGAALGHIHPGEPPDAIFAVLGVGFIFVIVLVAVSGTWLYYAYMESSTWQATLGKKALGLYVTDMEHRRISFARASGRFFGKIISGHFTIYIGYIMAGFTAQKQALHDMMASCLVLRKE